MAFGFSLLTHGPYARLGNRHRFADMGGCSTSSLLRWHGLDGYLGLSWLAGQEMRPLEPLYLSFEGIHELFQNNEACLGELCPLFGIVHASR
jgi:hypothetical protein